MSPVPLFLVATVALAAFALFLILRMLRASLPAARPVAFRQKRIEEQIRWDRLHPPAADA